MTDVRGTAERIARKKMRDLYNRTKLFYGLALEAAMSEPAPTTRSTSWQLAEEILGPNSPHFIRVEALLEAELVAAEAAGMEKAAKVAEGFYGGKAHTYASENADLYRAQDCACHDIAAAIRKEADNGR